MCSLTFESHFDPANGYTLKKMTPAEYILDPRWQVHGMAAKFVTPGSSVLGGHVEWFDAPELPAFFDYLRTQPDVRMVTYNALFDQSICAWRYGYIPPLMIDVLGMVRALYGPILADKSLGNVARYLNLPTQKGTMPHVQGMRTDQIKAAGLWPEFLKYGKDDIHATCGIYDHAIKTFPISELHMMDLVLRTTVDPMFRFNVPLLESHLVDLKAQKAALLDAVGLQYDEHGRIPELMSAAKFKVLLEGLGVVVEDKVSPITGRAIPALAKKDDFMQGLLEDPDPMVAMLAAARLGHKSTLEESRTKRYITGAGLRGGFWTPGAAPMPLRYGAAHTHRFGGDWKWNVQNLPAGRAGQTNKIRQAIEVDDNHVIMVADEAQIEARFSGWLAGEKTLLQEFADDLDPYGQLGASIFDLPFVPGFRKIHVVEGFIGKTGILGLGYQAGAPRFWRMVRSDAKVQLGRDVDFTMDQAELAVRTYRTRYSAMPKMWRYLGSEGLAALTGMGLPLDVGPFRLSWHGRLGKDPMSQGEITGPGGLKMVYPDLEHDLATGDWTYRMGKKRSKIYGGKVLENITQFGSRIIVMDAALRLYTKHGIRMGLQGHDELAFKVRKDDVERTKALVLAEMTRVPAWATGLPLKAEVGVGANYGAAK